MRFAAVSVWAAILLMGLTAVAQNASSQPAAMSAAEQSAASELVQDANNDRAPYHLSTLREDPKLTQAAWHHAQRMVASGALTHQVSGEPDLIVRVQQAGVHCNTVAENVAEGPTPDKINDEWMHSTSHRANLLDSRVNTVGVAVVKQHGALYAVEDFAHEIESMTPEEQEGQVASLLRARGLQVQAGGALVHGYCSDEPARQRPLPKLVMRYSTTDLSRLPAQIDQGIRSGNYQKALVGACAASNQNGFMAYQMVVLLH